MTDFVKCPYCKRVVVVQGEYLRRHSKPGTRKMCNGSHMNVEMARQARG